MERCKVGEGMFAACAVLGHEVNVVTFGVILGNKDTKRALPDDLIGLLGLHAAHVVPSDDIAFLAINVPSDVVYPIAKHLKVDVCHTINLREREQ